MPHDGEVLALLCSTTPPNNAPVSGSPYTYVSPDTGCVMVRGGLVSTIEVGRNSVFTTLNFKEGAVPVAKGDQVRVTYSTWWPTMTFFKG